MGLSVVHKLTAGARLSWAPAVLTLAVRAVNYLQCTSQNGLLTSWCHHLPAANLANRFTTISFHCPSGTRQ
ncbi:hypothetical protein GGR50DRAFT_665434 [Xylaria sp. CBS 124048]|nr:hypothetical protein GGR50DRAFT_665434 [Xylaria sp. CBS 124048]